ncbi:uncharacterized protein BX664DRAFT_341606 [Halteromyces radiatus]|uniref:uncharacterized protein n=1 Tax=Halteromyces radiatus TaxID=101107 RepID=UPI00221F074F|nr:uncharacterized protein BX664DRAFT_341606 [Halteromyces radiatus]KAI8079851.1 hypothetical protein BX664DRAFT_341606 [Halteromyces radiatus]
MVTHGAVMNFIHALVTTGNPVLLFFLFHLQQQQRIPTILFSTMISGNNTNGIIPLGVSVVLQGNKRIVQITYGMASLKNFEDTIRSPAILNKDILLDGKILRSY